MNETEVMAKGELFLSESKIMKIHNIVFDNSEVINEMDMFLPVKVGEVVEKFKSFKFSGIELGDLNNSLFCFKKKQIMEVVEKKN